jgi:2-keto-4-pentenoate hydratase/2-oxohepta-3-ene-1,7-dioic acid hydratase in catechol pathway
VRLCTFEVGGIPHAGVVNGNELIAVGDLVPGAPDDVVEIIAAGASLWDRLREAARRSKGGTPLAGATLRAPIPRPARNVFCVGWNYSEHFEEGKQARGQTGSPQLAPQEIPAFPSLFSKNPATVVGPDAPVYFSAPQSEQLDWEAELAVVIGTGGRDITEADAMKCVFGYTCANDVSVRDVQRRHGGQWFKGKNFDTHLPMGPWIVTADELDPADLAIRSRVNGVTKQDSRTKFMVFKIPRIIAEVSAGCELWPGDMIITGTPAGVGFARTPPEYLKIGDVVEVEIEGIGVLRNTIEGRS